MTSIFGDGKIPSRKKCTGAPVRAIDNFSLRLRNMITQPGLSWGASISDNTKMGYREEL
jgi:hypothetical protein